MQHLQFQAFANYNQRMNHKLYQAAGKLTPDNRVRDCKAFFGSVQATLQHIMVADLIWLRRFQVLPPLREILSAVTSYPDIDRLDQTIYPDFDELTSVRKRLDALIVEFAGALTPALLEAPFRYKNLAGTTFENSYWVYVAHFFNHQTHHRGQTTTMLTQMGVDVGVTDFPHVIKES
ncbi:MAG: DinB family protein [Bdellovibrionota bacterium]